VQQVLDFSRERMADRSNGILEFSVNHDFEDTNVFHFWERYTSNASLGQHNTQPEITQFMEDVSARTSSVACVLSASIACTEVSAAPWVCKQLFSCNLILGRCKSTPSGRSAWRCMR
jgi:quinol monooxygenase YgiN